MIVFSPGERPECGPSVGRGRVEFLDQPLEGGFKSGLVFIGPSLNEVDDLSVVVGGLFVVAAGLVDHSQSIVAVVDFGEAHEEVPCGLFGFVEFAVVDHIDDRVGRGGEFIGVIVAKSVAAEIAVSVVVVMVGSGGESIGGGLGEDSALGTLILIEAAALVFLSAAAVARIVASDLDLGHGGLGFYQDGARWWNKRYRTC